MVNNAVLITGASDGIGFEVVKIYLENNYNVIAHYHKKPKKLNKIKSNKLKLIQYDFEDTFNLKSFIRKCNENYQVEILINNTEFYLYDN